MSTWRHSFFATAQHAVPWLFQWQTEPAHEPLVLVLAFKLLPTLGLPLPQCPENDQNWSWKQRTVAVILPTQPPVSLWEESTASGSQRRAHWCNPAKRHSPPLANYLIHLINLQTYADAFSLPGPVLGNEDRMTHTVPPPRPGDFSTRSLLVLSSIIPLLNQSLEGPFSIHRATVRD